MNKENLELAKIKIDKLLSYIYDTKDHLNASKRKIDEGIIVNGKPLDNGKIEEDIKELDEIATNLINVRNHCNEKIELLQNNSNINSTEEH